MPAAPTGIVTWDDNGYNAATDTTCAPGGTGDVIDASLPSQLGPLAANGGPTETVKPIPGSSVAGVIPDPTTLNSVPVCGGGATDQIGDSRPLPAATMCTIGAVEVAIAACPAGSYSSTGDVPCTPTPAGSYDAGTGNTSATPCVAGTYSAVTGATSSATCAPADPGYFVALAGSTSETACPAGKYSTGGATACTPAPAGSYVGTTGAVSATLCAPGTYSSATGATLLCPGRSWLLRRIGR